MEMDANMQSAVTGGIEVRVDAVLVGLDRHAGLSWLLWASLMTPTCRRHPFRSVTLTFPTACRACPRAELQP
jgi:hypothetical protein